MLSGANIRRLVIGSFVFVFAWAFVAASQTFNHLDFEAFVQETMEASTVPGLAVIIFDQNGVTYENAFGVTDNEGTPTTLDTPFQLGSVSKSFAALLVTQLVDEGRLSLDTPVTNYLDNFNPEDAQAWQKITLRYLLSHRSGLSTFDGNRLQDNDYRGADALNRAVEIIEKMKLKSEAGEAYEYSNANYMMVAFILETVSGQTYESLMDERVFQPLGMTNSYVQMPLRETSTESMGFLQWFGKPVAQRAIPGRAWMAAGGVTASARDLALYVQAVANKDDRVIPASLSEQFTASEWQSSQSNYGYGLGWMFNELEGQKVIYHSGLNGGFAAHAAFFPESKGGGVVLTNQSGVLQADVPAVILRKALNLPTGPNKPVTGQYLILWGLVANVVMLLFFYILSTVRFSAYARTVGQVNTFRRFLPVLGLFGLAYGLIFLIPKMNGVPLMSIKVFQPDIWLCLTASSVIAILWGITRAIYPFK